MDAGLGRWPRCAGALTAGGLLAAAAAGSAAAADPALLDAARGVPLPPDCGAFQGAVWMLLALLALQSTAVGFLCWRLSRRRQAEEQLRAGEERFRLLVESSQVASYLIDRDGAIHYANRALCAMFGYQQQDVVGKLGLSSLIAPDDLQRVLENSRQRLDGLPAPSRYEAGGVHRNGEPIDLEITGSSASLGGSALLAGSLLDVSRLKRAESLLSQERAQREEMTRNLEERIREEVDRSREKDRLMLQQSRFAAMGEMIGNIAHQWRQPLNKLGIVLQRLQMEQENGELTETLMEQRVGDGMGLLLGLSRTIDDFRNFFRPEAAPEPFSLAGAVVKTVRFFEASCADYHIRIVIEGDSSLIYNGHVVEFRQALLNILNNARDAHLERGGADPSITVGLRDEEHRCVLTVRDNAGGVDPAIIDKIFDPYFTTRGMGNRTGIGLYMAKTIIDQQMQGRIMVRNMLDGAEFRIVL